MKKFYFAPEFAFVTFNACDIITSSPIKVSSDYGRINTGDCVDFELEL